MLKLRPLLRLLKTPSASYIKSIKIARPLFSQPKRFFSTEAAETPQPQDQEPPKHNVENLEFKTETKRLLDIVAKSLYQDKEVFIRELLSNCADALEKQRYLQMSGKDVTPGEDLRVNVILNEAKKQIIFHDTGVGMSRSELIENLGTIASSGSRKFLETISNESSNNSIQDNIIGQFGVGFYSSFIVGDTVNVISKPSTQKDGSLWISDGSGKFEISEIDDAGFERGTKIVIQLRPDCLQFTKFEEVKKVIQKYSNFINYPIYLNGEKLNLVGALWAKDKKEITDDEYKKFWEYVSGSQLPYKYKLHYTTDAPMSIKALIYIPSTHSEKYGFHAEENDISLYSKKILIKSKCKDIIPNWLRFIKGVVDCEDLPLNISRENYQDSALVNKLKGVITRKVIKTLEEEARKDEEGYLNWYKDFQFFLKEALASDQENSDSLLPLVRYHATFSEKYITIDDFVSKLKPENNKIYFLLAPNRESALNSPYMEPFKNTDIPVLFIYMHVDEMVFRGIQEYKKKYKFVNIESAFEEISKEISPTKIEKSVDLPEDEIPSYCLWIKNELQPVVNKVEVSKRLTDSPAIVIGQMSSGMRQVMSMLEKEGNQQFDKNLTFEINPNHEIIVKLNKVRKSDPKLASTIIRQILDNTLLTAGMLNDPKHFITRINKLMIHLLKNETGIPTTPLESHREIEDETARSEIESILNEIKEEEKKKEEKPEEIIIDEKGNQKVK